MILDLGTPEGYPALDPLILIKVDSKFGIMAHSNEYPTNIYVQNNVDAILGNLYIVLNCQKKPWMVLLLKRPSIEQKNNL